MFHHISRLNPHFQTGLTEVSHLYETHYDKETEGEYPQKGRDATKIGRDSPTTIRIQWIKQQVYWASIIGFMNLQNKSSTEHWVLKDTAQAPQQVWPHLEEIRTRWHGGPSAQFLNPPIIAEQKNTIIQFLIPDASLSNSYLLFSVRIVLILLAAQIIVTSVSWKKASTYWTGTVSKPCTPGEHQNSW